MASEKQDGDLAPDTCVGQYTIRRRIGAGGMGEVYEAVHSGLNKRVAIKTLRRQFAENETVVARFLREGQVASRIRHPNVVDVTDVGVIDGLPCLVMEFLEGESMHAVLKRDPVMQLDRLVDMMLPVLGAVEAAHQLGVVHRDLKPANIFIAKAWSGEPVPKVVDFGISKLLHDAAGPAGELTTDSTFLGSPHYVSPELARGERDLDGRSDQYAIGVILYEAACGVRPFAHRTDTFMSLMYAIAQGDFQPPRVHRPDLPREFETIVLKAMSLRKEARYPSLRDMARALLPYASERVRLLMAPSFIGSGLIASAAEVTHPDGIPRSSFEETNGTLGRSASSLASQHQAPVKKPLGWLAAGSLAAIAGLVVTWAGLTLVSKVSRATGPAENEAEVVAVSPTKTYVALVRATPEGASFTLDGVPAGTGKLTRTFVVGDGQHLLVVSADGHESQTIRFDDQNPPPAEVALEPLAEPTTKPAPRPAAHPQPRTEPRPEPKTETKPKTTLPTDNIDPWGDP